MRSIVHAATSGFKEYVVNQSQKDGDAYLTLYTFDDTAERVLDRVDLKDQATLALIDTKTDEWFMPRGMTALYDAMGKAIDEVGLRLANTPEALRPGKVIVVGITDGAENCSQFFKKERLRQMITEQTNKYKWDFVFIGTNQDAMLTATSIGIRKEAALYYSPTAKGTEGSYRALGTLTERARYMSSRGVDIIATFDDLERKIAVDANDKAASVLTAQVVDAQP
jgi:hypothetical protein